MASSVLLKRNSVAGTIPAANSLTVGELALNTADGKLYTKLLSNLVVQFSPVLLGGASPARGTATIDFGVFPGKSDTSVAITGQPAVTSSTVVKAWIYPQDTADHSADEHLVETLDVYAGKVLAGTGFTIYGVNESQLFEPAGGGTRLYGLWTVAWEY